MERISSFIKSYIHDDEGILGEIYTEAIDNKVPVIRRETRELLKTQLLLKKPMEVLEVGAAVGYSSLFMSQFLPEGAHITTMELDAERVKTAMANVLQMGKQDVIDIIEGDASEILKGLSDSYYDFVFVDAAKGQYIYYLPDVMRVTKQGGLIVSDNILQDGEILDSHYTVDKRNRTIHDRMREYLYEITNNENLDTTILSVGDGVALSIKRQ